MRSRLFRHAANGAALTLILCGAALYGQLIPSGSPIPRRAKPPVVFLNGYDNDCTDPSLAGTFGLADQVMQADGRASVFFNNCNFAGKPSIEFLGGEFGKYLAGLRYEDGQPVTTVDVVAYSMGGMIVRSYLSGKQETPGTFSPPSQIPIRKLVFIATPHFGTGIPLGIGLNRQVEELTSGNQFLYDLATWNQGTDDLRGVDAISIIGSGGTGRATTPGFDDGVVSLSSGSIGFVQPGKTRIIPFCHTPASGLIVFAGLCDFGVRGVAMVRNATEQQGSIILSFLNGTNDWKTVGTAAEDDRFLSANGGLIVSARGAGDSELPIASATAAKTGGAQTQLNAPSSALAYNDLVPSGALNVNVVSGTTTNSRALTLAAGTYQALVVKPGPWIVRVYPSATRVYPLTVAPGMFVSIYGDGLASQAAQTPSADFPFQLADAQVLVNGVPAPLHYASSAQINAVIPDNALGLTKLKVQDGAGSHTVNLLVETAVPSVFTQNGSGSGAASALNSRNNGLVTEANALRAGDYLQLYLTGLGTTTRREGLDWANLQPDVTIGGRPCAVSYAGRAPGYKGLDQINCLVPEGLGRNAAAAVVVTSGGRASNTTTVAVE